MAFDPLKDIPDLDGKVILVTGGESPSYSPQICSEKFVSKLKTPHTGNTGLGAATIKFLARRNPSHIYLCARPVSVPQGEALAAKLQTAFPGVDIRVRPLDLASLASVEEFAAGFLDEAERLDLLFLNAGISTTAPALTVNGYESQFGVNYVGHALLTQLLMPKLLATAALGKNTNEGKIGERGRGNDVRVLVTSSYAAYLAPPPTGLALDAMRQADALASPYGRYAHSKLANVLFARRLAQTYPGVLTIAFNPGQVKTDLFRKATGINWWFLMTVGMLFMHLTGISVDKGAENGLWAAFADPAALRNGAYYEPVGVLEDSKQFITDQALADELWDWTNRELERHGAPGWPET
jgi:NAD(P)-dependent dehydrogenase (short-subunit alcohol dehydrogenase family)